MKEKIKFEPSGENYITFFAILFPVLFFQDFPTKLHKSFHNNNLSKMKLFCILIVFLDSASNLESIGEIKNKI